MKYALIVMVSMAMSLIAQESPQAPLYQEWNAYKFHKHTKKTLILAKLILDRYSLHNCRSALDVGCGPGALTAVIAKNAPQANVVGIDPSDSMIRFARVRYGKQKNLHFMQEDMCNTSLTGPLDFTFSCNAFQYLSKEEQIKALKAMARLSNGTLLMIMAAKSDKPGDLEKAYAATIAMPQWKKLQTINLGDYYQPHNSSTFAQLIKDTGFLLRGTQTVDDHLVFKNVNKLRKFIKSWITGFGFVAALSKDEQKLLLRDLIQNYVKEVPPMLDGSIEWTSPRLVVYAEKAKT